MTTVNVRPMPEWMRKVPRHLWTVTPPIFSDISSEGITEADRDLARELFLLLDKDSQSWYARPWLFEKARKSKRKQRKNLP